MFDYNCKRKETSALYQKRGYGFPSFHNRWCNSRLKCYPFNKWITENARGATINVGIAFDEKSRRVKQKKNYRYPLIEQQITESIALDLCREYGFDFFGYYEKFKRSGCWFCPMRSKGDLKSIYHNYPDHWRRLCDLQQRAKEYFPLELFWKVGGKDLAKYEEKWSQETNDA